MALFRFGPAAAGESIVFGARRPGSDSHTVSREAVDQWVSFMLEQDIKRVVCVLPDDQLDDFAATEGGLLGVYRQAFGADRVTHEPIDDFCLCDADRLQHIMAALRAADTAGERIVVHCWGGSGRTGLVLAAWLVHARGFDPIHAIATVQATGRMPTEAVLAGTASEAELIALLEGCRPPRRTLRG